MNKEIKFLQVADEEEYKEIIRLTKRSLQMKRTEKLYVWDYREETPIGELLELARHTKLSAYRFDVGNDLIGVVFAANKREARKELVKNCGYTYTEALYEEFFKIL